LAQRDCGARNFIEESKEMMSKWETTILNDEGTFICDSNIKTFYQIYLGWVEMNDAVTAMRKYPGRKISLSPGSRECQGLANSDVISASTAIAASHGVESSDISTRKRENPKVTVGGGGSSAYHERQKVVLKIKSPEDGFCVRSSLKFLLQILPCLDNVPGYSSWAVMHD
jgi:hypothetical protein